MKLERKNVEFPLWRKKVDKSLFDYRGTTIPTWACDMWLIQDSFGQNSSKRSESARVSIEMSGVQYQGWVTCAAKGRKTAAYRLWFEDDLNLELKRKFLMSYMRGLETSLSEQKTAEVEKLNPFWEFLDIEFDSTGKRFVFTPYYFQEPSFPNLFSRLVSSPAIRKVDDDVAGKANRNDRIYKQDWLPRGELEFQVGALNVIYMLVDTRNKKFYVGETVDLVKRLMSGHPVIKDWDFFRYDVLPNEFSEFRVAIERMIIRQFAAVLSNDNQISSIELSPYKLVNKKIDT